LSHYSLYSIAIAFAIWKLNLWPLIQPIVVPMLQHGFETIQEKVADVIHGQQQPLTVPGTPSTAHKDKGKGKEKENAKPKTD